jgi:hypothetical protein
MGLLATFAGMIIFTAPESIAQMLKVQMPGILATQPGLLVSDDRRGRRMINFRHSPSASHPAGLDLLECLDP